MSLTPGARLGPYEVLAPVGVGGMGEVYKAQDTRLDRPVAIKVLPAHVASDPERKQRFEREAKTLAALSHPHICPVFDVGQQDGIDFLVMEYLEGETLAQRLTKDALPLDQALQYAIQIADALDKAHRKGIVHRPHAQRRGWLKNGNPPGDPWHAPRCGAQTRRQTSCHGPAVRNRRRCRLHGGKSTGPTTAAGLERIRRARWKHGAYSREVKERLAANRQQWKALWALLKTR